MEDFASRIDEFLERMDLLGVNKRYLDLFKVDVAYHFDKVVAFEKKINDLEAKINELGTELDDELEVLRNFKDEILSVTESKEYKELHNEV